MTQVCLLLSSRLDQREQPRPRRLPTLGSYIDQCALV
jgi:hypothetical protein